MDAAAPRVAIILPPHEGFATDRAGAIGMVAHAHARTPGFQCTVFGGPQPSTFPDITFQGVAPAWWFPGNINLRFGAALLRRLRRLQPALIEVHNRPELALLLARRLPRCPVLLFLHNDPQIMRRAKTARERMTLLRRLASVVTVSDYLRGRLMDGVPAGVPQPAVLPNGICLTSLPSEQLRQRLVLFVGRVVPDKAPDVFVAACAAVLPLLPGWRAAMLGADRFGADGPETAFVRRVQAQAAAAGVQVLGYRAHTAVLEAMARAAIVVVPSRWEEPFGLVALEAMASGAALICSPRGGLPEVAGDAALYVAPEPDALAKAILELAADPAWRQKLAEAGRKRARLFGSDRVGNEIARLRTLAIK